MLLSLDLTFEIDFFCASIDKIKIIYIPNINSLVLKLLLDILPYISKAIKIISSDDKNLVKYFIPIRKISIFPMINRLFIFPLLFLIPILWCINLWSCTFMWRNLWYHILQFTTCFLKEKTKSIDTIFLRVVLLLHHYFFCYYFFINWSFSIYQILQKPIIIIKAG